MINNKKNLGWTAGKRQKIIKQENIRKPDSIEV